MINQKFAFEHSTTQNDSTFDPKEYFSSFHYYEAYQPNKQYILTHYHTNHGKGLRIYENVLCKVKLTNDNGTYKVINYVYAQEILGIDEKKQLEPYCNCDWHTGNFITRLFIDKNSVGCLGSDFYCSIPQYRINLARKGMELDNKFT